MLRYVASSLRTRMYQYSRSDGLFAGLGVTYKGSFGSFVHAVLITFAWWNMYLSLQQNKQPATGQQTAPNVGPNGNNRREVNSEPTCEKRNNNRSTAKRNVGVRSRLHALRGAMQFTAIQSCIHAHERAPPVMLPFLRVRSPD